MEKISGIQIKDGCRRSLDALVSKEDEVKLREELKQKTGWTEEQIDDAISNMQTSQQAMHEINERKQREEIEVQTRSEENGLKFFKTVKEAFEEANKDKTVWKISFSVGEERVRLVRYMMENPDGQKQISNYWNYEPIIDDETLEEITGKKGRRD